jgi:hypothetical protein
MAGQGGVMQLKSDVGFILIIKQTKRTNFSNLFLE